MTVSPLLEVVVAAGDSTRTPEHSAAPEERKRSRWPSASGHGESKSPDSLREAGGRRDGESRLSRRARQVPVRNPASGGVGREPTWEQRSAPHCRWWFHTSMVCAVRLESNEMPPCARGLPIRDSKRRFHEACSGDSAPGLPRTMIPSLTLRACMRGIPRWMATPVAAARCRSATRRTTRR